MRTYAIAALAAFSLFPAAANATTMITPDGKVSIDPFDLVNRPFSWNVVANATQGDNLSGLASSIIYTFSAVDADRKVFTISYLLDNTSTGAGSQSSIAVFGFDVSPSANLTVTDGPFVEGSGGNFNGLGQREFCLYEGSNCNGGGNAGVYVNDAAVGGTFTLTYATSQSSILLENFATRWQRTGTNANGSASGIGNVTAVPEPATWAMMIAGFGLIGGVARRRKLTVRYA